MDNLNTPQVAAPPRAPEQPRIVHSLGPDTAHGPNTLKVRMPSMFIYYAAETYETLH